MVMDEQATEVHEAPAIPRPDYRGRWIALIAALVVRTVWLATVDTKPVTDFHWYFLRAISMVRGEGYSVDGVPTAYWPVGYPAFLAFVFKVFGTSVWIAKLSNAVLTLASVALAWRVAL